MGETKLSQIINSIKNGEDKYNELIENEYVFNTIKSIASSYAKTYNFEHSDVFQNSILEVYKLIDQFSIYEDKKENLGKSFINYLKKYLPKRLQGYYDSYTLFRNQKVDIRSIDAYENPENAIEKLRTDSVSQEAIRGLDIENIKYLLSEREEQVLFLLKLGYTQTAAAQRMGITQQSVNRYKTRAFKKIEKNVSNYRRIER